MRASAKHRAHAPFNEHLPAPVYFRFAEMPADSAYPQHRHAWGEFVYAYSGVMEVRIGERHWLTPAGYGLWLPPQLTHQGLNRDEASHGSLYICAQLAAQMPAEACAMAVSPLTRSLLDHLKNTRPALPYSEADERLLRVLVDQLLNTPATGSYLPGAADPLLSEALALIAAQPDKPVTLAALAAQLHTTERTLSRRARRDLGMTLSQWRSRLRVIEAIKRLEQGVRVETIAFDLGYASASALIAMFRRETGTTPDEYRRRQT
ncbi:helix-turn-helix transcriptional regulator [Granulosicoccaceae sp. 1_MG-2023]|nr:helix-turn-helix transcriptional regulator [Granulosicoccaceae sp. 1_MG-2023]